LSQMETGRFGGDPNMADLVGLNSSGDIDGDGATDVAVAATDAVHVLWGPSFGRRLVVPVAKMSDELALADLDGDLDLDLLLVNRTSEVVVIMN